MDKTLGQSVLEHFAEHHRRGGGCRGKGLAHEIGILRSHASRILRELWSSGKLTRRPASSHVGIRGGQRVAYKYYLPKQEQEGENPTLG